jgi:serine/threonine protein kinase
MSPEQCRGTGDVDCRADLYSIGCIFYEMVAGRPPFVRTGAGEAIGSHLFVDPEPPSRHVAGLSTDSETLIMKLLAKQPEHRVQTARELAQLLTAIAQQHGWMGTQVSTDVLLRTDAPTTTTLSPSTLSGAASEITEPPRRARSVVRLAVAGVLAMAVGSAGAALTFSGPARELPASATPGPAPSPVTAPPPRPPGPTTAPAPTPAPATTPVEPPGPMNPANRSAPHATIPVVVPQRAAPASAGAHPPALTPAAKPLKKPARKPDKAAGSASEDRELLEQDI